MRVWCTSCKDPFDPIEGIVPSDDEENFCSVDCAEQWADLVAAEDAYILD